MTVISVYNKSRDVKAKRLPRPQDDPFAFLDGLLVGGQRISVAFFQVALDGSGTLGQHSAIAYGGFIAERKQWSALTDPWVGILERHGLSYFKMAEAMKWHGEFKHKYSEWGDERENRRDGLIDDLASLAVRYEFKPAGMFADARLLGEQGRVTDKKVELFKRTIRSLLTHVPDGQNVTLICDEELDIEFTIRKWVKSLRRDKGDNIAPIVGICYMDDRVFPAIQLADMLAWLLRERGERLIKTGDDSLHPILAKLKQDSTIGLDQSLVWPKS